MWSSVNEQITDGTSGLASNASPSALIIGTSSKGGNSILSIGKKSNIESTFGYGELPKRLVAMQKTMTDTSILVRRSEGNITGTISEIVKNGSIVITSVGSPLFSSNVKIEVVKEGTISQAEFSITYTGDKNSTELLILPETGILELVDLGISITFPSDSNSEYTTDYSWEFSTTAPNTTVEELEKDIKNALELYTPEFVYIAQSIDVDFVNKLGVLSEQLFEDHKPVFFLTETDLDNTLSLDEAIAKKKEEFAKIDARFVSVVCEHVYNSPIKMSGLVAGHITKAQVNQSIGATNHFAITDYPLPQNWTNVQSRALDESRFITLRTYAGLNNLFWSNGRTMAGDTSDYRYIEVVRTVFKAIRIARRAVLPFIHTNGDSIGLQNLLTEVRSALDSMIDGTKKELDDYNVELPEGQDIVNNGIVLNIELFGIPIIRKMLLNFSFKYQNK